MSKDGWGTLEDYIMTLMQKEQIPGAAIAIAMNGETIYEQGFGYRDLKTKKVVTPNTVFGIASITKSMTALAIMKLVETGKVNLNASVTHYIPEFKFPSLQNMGQIKVHHLLIQRVSPR